MQQKLLDCKSEEQETIEFRNNRKEQTMKLVIGGAFQGKKKAACERYQLSESDFIDGITCKQEDIKSCRGIFHFHEYIKRMIRQGENPAGLVDMLYENNPEIIIVCNELGYGVVPIEKFDREYREAVGRLCCKAAEYSDEVVRVICGLGTVIKHA